jgi:hypothetical protein
LDEDDEFAIDDLSWDYAAPHSHNPVGPKPSRFSVPDLKSFSVPRISSFSLGSLSSLNPFSRSSGEGEPREIYLNDPTRNGQGKGQVRGTGNEGKGRWSGNRVGTGKYGAVSFIPKFLFGESIVGGQAERSGGEEVS